MQKMPSDKILLEPRHLIIVRTILLELVPHNAAWVFGSRAGGNPKPHSDLDIVLIDPPNVGESTKSALKQKFEESNLPFRIDVVFWNSLNKSFQRIVQDCHIPLN